MWARFSNEEGLEISVGAKKMIFDSYEKIKRYHQFNASLNGKMSECLHLIKLLERNYAKSNISFFDATSLAIAS
jgi:hypothetical protein